VIEGKEFITVYWLSGLFQEKYEIWKGRKDHKQPDPGSTGYTLYLLFPLKEEEDEAHLTISATDQGWHFSIDWFPDEEFPLQPFSSENQRELLFMSEFQRENVFLHLT
jgi:hypothetical protein